MNNFEIYTYSRKRSAEKRERSIIDRSVTEYFDAKVTEVGLYAFASCDILQKVDLPNCTFIKNYAFQSCSSLSDVQLPKGTTCGYSSFNNCRALATIDLPKCESINQYCFGNCSALTALILRSERQCNLVNTNALAGTPIASGTGYVYVPDALVSTYKSAARWSTYAAQIKPISELPGGD